MGARNHISKSRKRFESWKIQTSEGGGGQGGKMPSPPHMLTNQETALLTGEGLMLQMEAPLRECSRLLQAKYLINDSQQTHKLIPTHIHTQLPFSCGPETELNVPLEQFGWRGTAQKTQVHHTNVRAHIRSEAAATETQTGYSPHPCGAQSFLPCIFANVWKPLTQTAAAKAQPKPRGLYRSSLYKHCSAPN